MEVNNNPQIDKTKQIHFIGIGGEGMSPIARVLVEKGFKVSGSDMRENINTIRLKDKGAKIYFKHHESNIRSADIIVTSTAIPQTNVEVIAAKENNIPIIRRAKMLSYIMDQEKHKIAVAGTHGKTTTSSMLAQIFLNCKTDPTFVIGGQISSINTNYQLGEGNYFLAEADESDGSLLDLNPTIALITNIEPEHLDYYRNLDHIFETFNSFAQKIPRDGFLVLNLDHPNNKKLMESIDCKVYTYGEDSFADLRVENIEFHENTSSFDVIYKHKYLTRIELRVPGMHNINNALGALLLGLTLELPIEPMRQALYSFTGTKKRFQPVGEVNDILLFDDYAHHPTEIEATLNAAKNGWPNKRTVAIFQPHRYTRTKLLADSFAKCFKEADEVIITNIFAASEQPIMGISGKTICDELKKAGNSNVIYINKKDEIPQYLANNLKSGDIVITMGAGDIHKISKETLTRLKHQELTNKEG